MPTSPSPGRSAAAGDPASLLTAGSIRRLFQEDNCGVDGENATVQVLRIAHVASEYFLHVSDGHHSAYVRLSCALHLAVEDDALRAGQLCVLERVAPSTPCPEVAAFTPLSLRLDVVGAPAELAHHTGRFKEYAAAAAAAETSDISADASLCSADASPAPRTASAAARRAKAEDATPKKKKRVKTPSSSPSRPAAASSTVRKPRSSSSGGGASAATPPRSSSTGKRDRVSSLVAAGVRRSSVTKKAATGAATSKRTSSSTGAVRPPVAPGRTDRSDAVGRWALASESWQPAAQSDCSDSTRGFSSSPDELLQAAEFCVAKPPAAAVATTAAEPPAASLAALLDDACADGGGLGGAEVHRRADRLQAERERKRQQQRRDADAGAAHSAVHDVQEGRRQQLAKLQELSQCAKLLHEQKLHDRSAEGASAASAAAVAAAPPSAEPSQDTSVANPPPLSFLERAAATATAAAAASAAAKAKEEEDKEKETKAAAAAAAATAAAAAAEAQQQQAQQRKAEKEKAAALLLETQRKAEKEKEKEKERVRKEKAALLEAQQQQKQQQQQLSLERSCMLLPVREEEDRLALTRREADARAALHTLFVRAEKAHLRHLCDAADSQRRALAAETAAAREAAAAATAKAAAAAEAESAALAEKAAAAAAAAAAEQAAVVGNQRVLQDAVAAKQREKDAELQRALEERERQVRAQEEK
eukprot:Rhum_TRINITY_DN11845_c0_g1::Rhum_TRINITY_DN11845_c0_g1_i1::g.47424::m.47424